jgi:putative ABC transport system ATP-binding protein
MLFVLEAVTASRGGRVVLQDTDLEIAHGATALTGPSGAGKSTLLRLLNRLADPDAGVVLYRGRDVRELDPLALRREVCLVPQMPALDDGTVADNVALGPSFVGLTADVPRALRRAGLDAALATRDASELSVGQQQRVMLARALALEPEVLLLDEPTSALDGEARDAVEATLAALDVSIVIVTHDDAQAERVGDRVVHVDHGHVHGPGAPDHPERHGADHVHARGPGA